MATGRPGRPGRPTLSIEAKRKPLSLRVTPTAYARLTAAAEASGRSLTQELEFRLEASLEQDLVRAVVDAALVRLEQKIDALGVSRSQP